MRGVGKYIHTECKCKPGNLFPYIAKSYYSYCLSTQLKQRGEPVAEARGFLPVSFFHAFVMFIDTVCD